MAYTSFDNLFNDMLEDIFNGFGSTPIYYYTELSNDERKAINATVNSELPYNMFTNSDGLELDFAMAGVSKDKIKFEVANRDVTITIDGDKVEDIVYLHKGLKVPSDKNYIINAKINEKFDCSKIKVSFVEGLLKVFVPLKDEVKPKTIKID